MISEILSGTAIAAGARVIGALAAIGFNVAIIRILGANSAGVFYLAFSVVSILSVVCRLGLDGTIVRFVSANSSLNKSSNIRKVYLLSCRTVALGSLLLFTLNLIFSEDIAVLLSSKGNGFIFSWFSFYIVSQAFLVLHTEALKGLKKIFLSNIFECALMPIMMLGYILVVDDGLSLINLVIAYVLCNLFVSIAAMVAWFMLVPPSSSETPDISIAEFRASHSALFVVSLLGLMTTWAGTLILGNLRGPEDVAILQAVLKVVAALTLITVSFNAVIAPNFSALYRTRQYQKLKAVFTSSMCFLILAVALIAGAFCVAAPWILGLFGGEFVAQKGVLIVLTFAYSISAISGPFFVLLNMTGNETFLRKTFLLCTSIYMVLLYFLVDELGVIGVAWSSLLINLSLFLMYLAYSKMYVFNRGLGMRR